MTRRASHDPPDPIARSLLPAPPAAASKAELTDMLAGEGFNGVNPTFMLGRAIAAGRVLVGRSAALCPSRFVPNHKACVVHVSRLSNL